MKRYVRLLDTGDFYDTTKTSCASLFGWETYDEVTEEDLESCLTGDNVFDLIQVGDLLERFSKDGNIQMLTRVINHEAEIKVIRSHDNITKIYTLQNENFILVWDKERGVI